jgi:hypothetical protein
MLHSKESKMEQKGSKKDWGEEVGSQDLEG